MSSHVVAYGQIILFLMQVWNEPAAAMIDLSSEEKGVEKYLPALEKFRKVFRCWQRFWRDAAECQEKS